LSLDGKQLLTACHDKLLRLFDLDNGKQRLRFEGHTEPPICVAFSPVGRRALSGGWDKTVRLWDLDKGCEVRRLAYPIQQSVAFSPDGRFVLAGGQDGTMVLWKPDTDKVVQRFAGQ